MMIAAAHREVGGGIENFLHKNDVDDRSNDNDTDEEEDVGGQSSTMHEQQYERRWRREYS